MLIDSVPLETQDDINFSNEIGYVSQQTSIFTGSIRYNITLDEDFSDEEIWNVLKKVCLDDRVKSLDNGLDHELENMGGILSGGEKQRLVLARVLIRNYPILILDEATSALDNESEKLVQDALEKLMKGKTTFVIAHRLTTIENSNKIVVIQKGGNKRNRKP